MSKIKVRISEAKYCSFYKTLDKDVDSIINVVNGIVKKHGDELLYRAAADCHYKTVSFLVKTGIELSANIISNYGANLVYKAAENSEYDNVVKTIVEKQGDEVLYRAASDCQYNAVIFLVGNGINLNASIISKYGDSLASRAASDGQFKAVQFFVDVGVDVNVPLYEACGFGDQKIVDYLLAKGANPNSEKCLSIALQFYHQEIFKTLIRNRAFIKLVSLLFKCDFLVVY